VVPNSQIVRTLEAIRQRRTIPEDLPPISSDEDLVAWGQQLIGKVVDPPRRREPLRAERNRREPLRAVRTEAAPRPSTPVAATPSSPTRARSAETMTLDELFDDIAARAARAHRGSSVRRAS
jgi:hypothetical protein